MVSLVLGTYLLTLGVLLLPEASETFLEAKKQPLGATWPPRKPDVASGSAITTTGNQSRVPVDDLLIPGAMIWPPGGFQ